MWPSFFPVYRDRLDDPAFAKLPILLRVMYFLLVSEWNWRKQFDQVPFYRANSYLAVQLKCSYRNITRLATRLVKLGWIDRIPGHNKNRWDPRGIASLYTRVLDAMCVDGRAGGWQCVPRLAFLAILRNCGPAEALAFVYIAAEAWRFRLKPSFDIPVVRLERWTGIRNVRPLVDRMATTGGWTFFKVSGDAVLRFTDWSMPMDEKDLTRLENVISANAAILNAKTREAQTRSDAKRLAKPPLETLTPTLPKPLPKPQPKPKPKPRIDGAPSTEKRTFAPSLERKQAEARARNEARKLKGRQDRKRWRQHANYR